MKIPSRRTRGYSATSSNVLPTLPGCAQIGLCRCTRSPVAITTGALAALDAIDLDKEGLFKKISYPYVTTAYHVGFSYFMLGRYTDAIRHLNRPGISIQRPSHRLAQCARTRAALAEETGSNVRADGHHHGARPGTTALGG